MDEQEEKETIELSWREKLSKLFGSRSRRVSVANDVESSQNDPERTADNSSQPRQNSTLDVPLLYVPQFDTHELRENNEECPRVNSEPTFAIRPNAPLTVPSSSSAVSGRSIRSALSQVAENRFQTLFTVWDTRHSMKLFGSQNAIKKEEERRKSCKHWIIHPCSKFRYIIISRM